jgi:type II secretory ATPase GspE/PulE/Tfp pilus assembly ATPase PilB-like protein
MTGKSDFRLIKLLLSEGIFNEDELNRAEEGALAKRCSLQSYLVLKGLLDEEKLLFVISKAEGMELINLNELKAEETALKAVPAKFTWHYNFVPVKLDGNILTIAVNEPLPVNVQDELRLILGYQIKTVLARKKHIQEVLKSKYGLGSDTIEKMVSEDAENYARETAKVPSYAGIDDVEKLAGDASVIRLVNQIIMEAYRKRATDIHVEPFRGKLRLRYRIDGVMQDQKVPEEVDRFLPAILSRIKIMSNLNIVERRLPQDGRAIVKTQDEVLDLRVSFIPTPHGESVVIRVLPSKMFFGLGRLGLSNKDIDMLRELMKRPSGIIFATGPTGSGKSTTLYACMGEVDKTQKKIITIEDPIEYEMADITQIQVNEASGLTFATGLRSMLRHDPDIMMVGEVRDRETADIAIRVALTGHLILSTLHTNDAATGVTRLIDIGIEPYLVASSVEAFLAQRLVRVLCPKCKTAVTDISPEIRECVIRNIGLDHGGEIKLFRGKGCENCNYTGFHGRTAIYEILIVDREIKRLIIEKATASEIKSKAVENGMTTLMRDGWYKVMKGVTTPEEIMKVCQDMETEQERSSVPEKIKSEKEAVREDKTPNEKKPEPSEQDQRIYLRVPARVKMKYRLLEKGEGDIVFIDGISDEGPRGENIFTGEIFERSIPYSEFVKKVYREVNSTTSNISAGGAVFESMYLLPKGSIIELVMEIPGISRSVKCLSKVVRLDKNPPRVFNMAVCYLDMSGEDRKIIDDFVKKEKDKMTIREIKRH